MGESGWMLVLFLIIGDSCSLRRSIRLQKKSGEDEEIKLKFKYIIALEHLGANEQWSLWSTAHMEDCSLGLLCILVLHVFVTI